MFYVCRLLHNKLKNNGEIDMNLKGDEYLHFQCLILVKLIYVSIVGMRMKYFFENFYEECFRNKFAVKSESFRQTKPTA